MRGNLFAVLFLLAVLLFSSPARADCTGPAGPEGQSMYNVTYHTMQFCDGTNWIAMGGGGTTIAADTILETMLKSVNAPTDEYCLTYETTTGDFEWQTCGSGGDNLGNHTATANLNLGTNYISRAGTAAGLSLDASNNTILSGSIKVANDAAACTAGKDGAIRYKTGVSPPWEYCDGGTTTWRPFKQPRCQDNGTGECYLDATRSNDDPDFIAANIACGVNILGVVGTLADSAPDAFSFTDVTDQPLSTLVASNTLNITGLDVSCPASVSVSGNGSPQIRINGGAWGTSGTITNGQTLQVRLTSAATGSTMYSATVNVGSGSDQWDVTTLDDTPDAFAFTDLMGQDKSTLIASNSVNITGITGSIPVSVSGGGSPQISINGGAWGTSGTITNGQTLQVRLTSSASSATMLSATVTVGSGSDQWDVTTLDDTPDAFYFTDVTGQALSTLITSDYVNPNGGKIVGITGSVPVSVSGQGSPQISINGGAWGTSGTITNGQTLQVRLTSSSSSATMYSATVTVGTASDQWDVTTSAIDDTPDAFSFTDQTGVEAATLTYSNIINITGITGSVSVSVSGSGSPRVRINGGAWVTSGTITNGQTLQVRLTSSSSYGVMRSATVTVGTGSDQWDVTTRGLYVFATSAIDEGGEIDGLQDEICQLYAAEGELEGNYIAWLSYDGDGGPAAWLPHQSSGGPPYILPNGTKIADNWNDLTDGSLDAPINRDEGGNSASGTAWTNVTAGGVDNGSTDCGSWDSSASTGRYGSLSSTGSAWTASSSGSCTTKRHLYCFQADPDGDAGLGGGRGGAN